MLVVGIGSAMSLFIGSLACSEGRPVDAAKVGTLAASLVVGAPRPGASRRRVADQALRE